jgi:hypothetical protein
MAKKQAPDEPTLTQRMTPNRVLIGHGPTYKMVDEDKVPDGEYVATRGRFHNFTFYGENFKVYRVFPNNGVFTAELLVLGQ